MTHLSSNSLILPFLAMAISRPDFADSARYGTHDSAGNAMDCLSVIELQNQTHKYAGVYHTGTMVGQTGNQEIRFDVNLSVSNNLMDWEFKGQLAQNASMPEIKRVENSPWVVVAHEKWTGNSTQGGSQGPCKIQFRLFYDDANLVNCTTNADWIADVFSFQSDPLAKLNGTPNFYEVTMEQDGQGYFYAKGAIGFHFWNGQRDMVGNAAFTNLFTGNPQVQASWVPSEATDYNNLYIRAGVTGNIGQRTYLHLSSGQYLLQEANIGTPGASWDKWRIYSYAYNDGNAWPTGNGEIFGIFPQTPNDSVSFGNPKLSVVSSPTNLGGQALVISYYLFHPGNGNNEAGGLIYYFNIPT